ncbi:hypothetical protein QBC46DRAFT_391205 [Diplogelasinospora grovesii]|uniref:Uncharacterized protein n=1 Tax=Diplogelasinospora grovesii TaxID=303347 RepID=A0AAN6N4B0_9PEZI|nr:hypothetical protein QBC46DRAFT_391205 [Diplogelasinospora grovesii]
MICGIVEPRGDYIRTARTRSSNKVSLSTDILFLALGVPVLPQPIVLHDAIIGGIILCFAPILTSYPIHVWNGC